MQFNGIELNRILLYSMHKIVCNMFPVTINHTRYIFFDSLNKGHSMIAHNRTHLAAYIYILCHYPQRYLWTPVGILERTVWH